MMDDTAMVVSVKNRTVITALPKEQARDNVFTNIDADVARLILTDCNLAFIGVLARLSLALLQRKTRHNQ